MDQPIDGTTRRGSDKANNGTPLMKATKPTKANACCTFVVNIIMLIFFCYYIFGDPDESDCFVNCSGVSEW